MSKKSKKAASDRRASMKRARKEAQQKQYQAWTSQGINQLSRRTKLNAKRARKHITKRHREAFCGNPGCQRCFAQFAAIKLNNSNDLRAREVVNVFSAQRVSSKPWRTSKEKLAYTQRQRTLNDDRPLSQADTLRLMHYLNTTDKASVEIYGPRLARSLIVNTPAVEDLNRPLAKPVLKRLMALLNLSEKEAKAYAPKAAREKLGVLA